MAQTPEVKVKARVKKFLTEREIYFTMPFTAGYGASGVPDFLVCYQGRFIALECKANGNKPTALQEDNMNRIRRSKGIAVVVDETNVDFTLNCLFNAVGDDDGRC